MAFDRFLEMLFSGEKGGKGTPVRFRKDFINLLALGAAAGIILMLVYNLWGMFGEACQKPLNVDHGSVITAGNREVRSYEQSLAEEMERVLSQVAGVGAVEVILTFEQGDLIEVAQNTKETTRATRESDDSGGTRVIEESITDTQVVTLRGEQGLEEPLVLRTIKPRVRGVIVVAEGAERPVIKARLTEAVVSLLDTSPHRVRVYSKK